MQKKDNYPKWSWKETLLRHRGTGEEISRLTHYHKAIGNSCIRIKMIS